MLYAVAGAADQVDGGVTPAGQLAVVDAQPRVVGVDADGNRKFVVVLMTAVTFAESACVMLQATARVRSLQAHTGQPRIRSRHSDERPGGKSVTADQGAGRPVHTAVAGQGDPARQFEHALLDVDALRALDRGVTGDVDRVTRFCGGQRLVKLIKTGGGRAGGGDCLGIARPSTERVTWRSDGAASLFPRAHLGGSAKDGTCIEQTLTSLNFRH